MMKKGSVIIFTFIYGLLCLIGVHCHEPWLDEAHHFLLVKNSHSFHELFINSRYEGHPLLWDMLMYIVFHISPHFFCIQLFHVMIGIISVYLILKYAPFGIFGKLGIVFGYFMAYEYSILTRNYAISVLLIILILIQISREDKKLILISGLMMLLCNTHLFSCFVALGFIPVLFGPWKKSMLSVKLWSVMLLMTGLILAYIQIMPPHDHFWQQYNQEPIFSVSRAYKAAWVPLKGLLPIPDLFKINYWNSNVLIDYFKPLAAFMSVVLFIIPLMLMFKQKQALLMFYITTMGVMLMVYLTPLMLTSRNCGFVSVALCAAIWIAKTTTPFPLGSTKKILSAVYVGVILVIQLFSGVCIYVLDFRNDFSCAKNTADYLNAFVMQKPAPVLLTHHSSGPSLVLNSKHNIFYLESNKMGSFCEWNTYPFVATDSTLLRRIFIQMKDKQMVVVLANEPHRMELLSRLNLKLDIIRNLKTVKVREFTGATVSSENYYMYVLTH
ncbi:MAG: hypothetical protein HY062_11985 [Bacteroidetes bacterium]|nr:hypothetical protein [Bacteroidota bacterium]